MNSATGFGIIKREFKRRSAIEPVIRPRRRADNAILSARRLQPSLVLAWLRSSAVSQTPAAAALFVFPAFCSQSSGSALG
jgi:hypothetical protein